jgi:hypothetical protein
VGEWRDPASNLDGRSTKLRVCAYGTGMCSLQLTGLHSFVRHPDGVSAVKARPTAHGVPAEYCQLLRFAVAVREEGPV